MCHHVSRFAAAVATALLIGAGLIAGPGVEPLRAQPNCTIRLDNLGATAPLSGGTFTVTVFPDPANCNFQVSVLTPGVGTIVEGPGNTVIVTVPANPGTAAREGRFQIGDQVFRVVQAGESAQTPWHIGDVFVGAGSEVEAGGVYKTLAPQGTPKPDVGSATPTSAVPDLLDGAGFYSSGCMVDPTGATGNGHLFTASWKANTLSVFDGVTHQLRDVFPFVDPKTIHPYDDAHQDEVGVNTLLADMPRAAGVPPLPLAAIGVADDPSTTADEFVTPAIQAFEQVVFADNGEFYAGTQTPVYNNDLGLGHGYLLRFRYDPSAAARLTLTGWWKLDAGAIADRSADRALFGDPIYADGTSRGASGVDQFDLSSDQQTIFYTSEDGYIRHFNVATGTQGADIRIKNSEGQPLGVRAYGIRILPGPIDPDGVPGAGFIVATNANMVIRVDRNGKVLTRYEVPGLPFAVNLTPDAQYFWTATQDNGVASRFHIASGAGATFDAGAAGVFGLCVKREYSAATSNGQCVDLNLDGSYGPETSACRTPAVCTAGGVDNTGAQNAECLPPGISLPVYVNQANDEGDSVLLDLRRDGFKLGHILGLDQIPDLVVSEGGLITGTILPTTCTPGPGDDPACEFTINVRWMLQSDFDAGRIHWQQSTFTWTVTHGNSRPTLSLPATSPTTLPVLVPATIPLTVFDLDTEDHILISVTGLPDGFTARRRTSYGDGWLLTIDGTPGVQPIYPKPYPVHVDIWDCESNFAQLTAGEVNALPPPQRDAALRAKIAASPGSCYHSATPLDFTITIGNATPTLNPLPQFTLLGASVSYQIPANDADGHPLTWNVENLPANLSADANGLVTGTATVEVSAQPVKVTVTDIGGSSVTRTFPWTVYSNRPPVCATATITPSVLWSPNHKLVPFSIQSVTDPDNDALTIVITSITQNQPVNDKGDGNTGFDATGVGTSSGAVRAERTGNLRVPGDGRVYEITFTASDGKTNGTCGGTLTIEVPHDQGRRATPVANGCRWNSVTGDQIGTCAWLNAPARPQR